MEEPAPTLLLPPLRSPRRWFRFSLRTLLVVTTALGCGLGWVVAERETARRQINALRERGVKTYSRGRPAWSRIVWGDALPGDVICALCSSKELRDADLVHLRGFAMLTNLDLSRTSVTGVGLVHLENLPRLRKLGLNRAQITEVGLAHLQKVSQLESINLRVEAPGDDEVARVESALPRCKIAFYTNLRSDETP